MLVSRIRNVVYRVHSKNYFSNRITLSFYIQLGQMGALCFRYHQLNGSNALHAGVRSADVKQAHVKSCQITRSIAISNMAISVCKYFLYNFH